MKNQRKLLLLFLVLLLISVGLVVAQSSTNYAAQRSVLLGGGSADSASYSVTSVIGQPSTDLVDGSSYKVSGGFLFPVQQGVIFDETIWLPVIHK